MMSLYTKVSTTRKVLLITGICTLLISICIVFPIESSKTNFLEDFGYTFFTLAIALLLLLYGLLGKHFLIGLLFVITSSIAGAIFFYVAYPLVPFTVFVAIWLGIPSGLITAIIFMIANFYFFNAIKKYKLIKQIGLYVIILFIVSVLFGYGGDWIYEITEYFKN